MIVSARDFVVLQTRIFSIEETAAPILRATKGNDMTTKLTPRQNELISEALVRYSLEHFNSGLPQSLKELRKTLVKELKAVSSETENC